MIYNFKWIPVFTGMTICLFLSFPLSVLSTTFQGNVNIGANIKRDPTMPVPIPPEPISESISEIVINNGAKYTNSLDAVLYFFVKDAFQVMVNNKDNFYGIFWQPFQFTKEWKLAPGEDGKRTVYAKFKSVSGGFSKVVSDSIILDRVAPANVSGLTASADKKQIELKWQNPADEDLKSVRILRSENFFPINPESKEDEIVFNQKRKSFLDANVKIGRTYYYTVFSYDYAGNFSSGALISARLKSASEISEEEKEETALIPSVEKSPFKYLKETPDEKILQSVKDLSLKDFDFFQEGEKIEFLGGDIVNAKPEIPLTILIDYEKLPEVLKTIIVTLEKPIYTKAKPHKSQRFSLRIAHAESKYFSFLLRINSDKTAYEAKIMPPEIGNYPLTIGILDVKNQISKKVFGILKVEEKKEKKQIIAPSLLTRFPFASFVFLILILIVIISLIWIIANRKRFSLFR
jgi:hypothetical protein